MDKAVATQLANIEKRTGKSLAELTAIVKSCGLQKHGEIRDYLCASSRCASRNRRTWMAS